MRWHIKSKKHQLAIGNRQRRKRKQERPKLITHYSRLRRRLWRTSITHYMDADVLRDKVVERLQTIFDPEIPVSIYELGLIYRIDILPINNVQITMTLTAPSCPAAQSLPIEVDQKLREIEGVNDVHVAVTWDPPWDKSMMSEVAQLELGWM